MNWGLMQGLLPVPVSRGDPYVIWGSVPCTIKTPKSQVNGTVFKQRCLEKLTPMLAWVGWVFSVQGGLPADLAFFFSVFFGEQETGQASVTGEGCHIHRLPVHMTPGSLYYCLLWALDCS